MLPPPAPPHGSARQEGPLAWPIAAQALAWAAVLAGAAVYLLWTGDPDRTLERILVGAALVPLVTAYLLVQPAVRANSRKIRQMDRRRVHLRRRFVELRGDHARARASLASAGRLQASLLPQHPPAVPGAEFAWVLQPCEELGGDMFNVVALDDDHVGLFVLDVTGHGAEPSLLAVNLYRALTWGGLLRRPSEQPPGYEIVCPGSVARRLNRMLPAMAEPDQFFTFCYGILEVRTGAFTFTRAGHPGPVVATPHRVVAQPDHIGGPMIGLDPDAEFPEWTLVLRPGDRLFLLSDGVEEAFDGATRFGGRRIARLLADYQRESLGSTVQGLLQAVRDFLGTSRQNDDITILAVARAELVECISVGVVPANGRAHAPEGRAAVLAQMKGAPA